MSATPQASSFGPVAEVYDDLMRQVPYRMWIGYYQLLLSVQIVKPVTILDVCCGTGSMCEMLYREGYDMTGFDLSAGMIEVAKKKAKRKKLPIQYHVADAAEFDFETSFDAALSFFDSLNNITSPKRLKMAFERVAAHLKPGGSFIFDMNTAYAFQEQMFDQQNLKASSRLRYKWVGDWDEDKKLCTVTMKFWKDDDYFEEVHVQRAYDPDEVILMLEDSGFSRIQAYTSYSLNPPQDRSDRIHFVAIRA